MTSPVQKPQFQRAVVCFLDVLGMRELMKAPEAEDNLDRLKRAIDCAADRHLATAHFPPGFGAMWFTDNVLLTWPWPDARDDGEMELGYMYMVASGFMLDMALEGFFVRGGVTAGDVYVDTRFAFGPALVEAVELEKDAVHPRVVLSEQALALSLGHAQTYYAEPAEAPQASLIIFDDNLAPFLNYLEVIEEEEDPDWRLDTLTRHRDRIVAALATAPNPRVREKFEWLARYHNHYCAQAFPHVAGIKVSGSGDGFLSLADGLRGVTS